MIIRVFFIFLFMLMSFNLHAQHKKKIKVIEVKAYLFKVNNQYFFIDTFGLSDSSPESIIEDSLNLFSELLAYKYEGDIKKLRGKFKSLNSNYFTCGLADTTKRIKWILVKMKFIKEKLGRYDLELSNKKFWICIYQWGRNKGYHLQYKYYFNSLLSVIPLKK
jgi:hypothetical protein